MEAQVERGLRAIVAIDREGLTDAFIDAMAHERVSRDEAERLASLLGYALDEEMGVRHVPQSAVAHAAAAVALLENLQPLPVKLPFEKDEGIVVQLAEAPFFTLERIEAHIPIDQSILDDFHAALPVRHGRYCITEQQIYWLMHYYAQSRNAALALHDFAFRAAANGQSYHYSDSFFQKHPLDPANPADAMLYALASEQRLTSSEFSTIYGVIHD